MLSKNWRWLIVAAIAPMVWGSTYIVTTSALPPGRPLLAATLRALPAGLLLLLLVRSLPRGQWWWKSLVLGILNVGAFFALLFVAAYRLPGGIAAVAGGVSPLLVALLALVLLRERLRLVPLVAALGGALGVALIVLKGTIPLDLIGILAAFGGTLSMAAGLVLAKKWGSTASPLAMTAWQLLWGGLFLAVLLFTFEGLPNEQFTGRNLLGYAYLTLVGTALAYVCWFAGLRRLPATAASFLSLLSPVVAVLLGWVFLSQGLGPIQILGAVIVLASVVAGSLSAARKNSSAAQAMEK